MKKTAILVLLCVTWLAAGCGESLEPATTDAELLERCPAFKTASSDMKMMLREVLHDPSSLTVDEEAMYVVPESVDDGELGVTVVMEYRANNLFGALGISYAVAVIGSDCHVETMIEYSASSDDLCSISDAFCGFCDGLDSLETTIAEALDLC